jgi:hypothetical protein
MSLSITFISRDPNFGIDQVEKEIDYPHNDLFGLENWRKDLWGHEIMKSIECNMLYSLKHQNVYVFDDGIQKLKIELEKVLENITLIADVTNNDKEAIEFRVRNALEKTKIANKYIDKIGIAIE